MILFVTWQLDVSCRDEAIFVSYFLYWKVKFNVHIDIHHIVKCGSFRFRATLRNGLVDYSNYNNSWEYVIAVSELIAMCSSFHHLEAYVSPAYATQTPEED